MNHTTGGWCELLRLLCEQCLGLLPAAPTALPSCLSTHVLPTGCCQLNCRSYIACDLGSLFDAAGFSCGTKWLSSATKTLSFTKPLQA
jgi:hypothetical protein